MDAPNPELAIYSWFSQANYALMEWAHHYWWPAWAGIAFIGCLIGMAPLSTHHEQPFYQIVFVWVRKAILWISALLAFLPFLMAYIYEMTATNPLQSRQIWLQWFVDLARFNWFTVFSSAASGVMLRFILKRYALPAWSAILRRTRNIQTKDRLSDIREESSRFIAKDFLPSKFYAKDAVLVGLDEQNRPIRIPLSTWYETNMQVIGPTRYGKGVILGGLMDQAIRRGDCLFYIDPKRDKFAPHVMYQACKEMGRKFYYLTLHDDGIGKWAPFAGGNERDGLSRLETAFGLEFTGDPGTDYYKGQEMKELEKAFRKTRHIEGLKHLMEATEANRINAELARWASVESLCPKKGSGFSIEKALKEGAVVYAQGSLDDSVVKTATKIFIAEMIQEARRLDKERSTHLTAVIDEVSFLASKTLAQALATAVGFRVNFVLAYQSQNDLLNLDDKSVNSKYVHHSINVNSQIKAIYGGADFETAEWAANLSGTIAKEITKMEKTEISNVGGETWENQRFVGTQEENFINTNMVLALPPRVCVFVQPRHLATTCFTSFVPVKDMNALVEYIKHKEKVYSPAPQQPASAPEISEVPEELNLDQPARSQNESETKATLPAEQKRTEKIVMPKPSSEAAPSPKTESLEEPAEQEKVEQEPIRSIEHTEFINDHSVESVSRKAAEDLPAASPANDELSEEELNKKREKNKARKAKQKAKKLAAAQAQQAAGEHKVSQAKQQLNTPIQEQNLAPVEVNEANECELDFLTLTLQSDAETMRLLQANDDENQ